MTIVSYDGSVTLQEEMDMPYQTFFNLAEEKKKAVIMAAIDEFYEFGYQKASIARIVEKSAIARGSFYQYFEDKKDLYRYIIINVIGERKHSYSMSLLKNIDSMDFIEIIKGLFINGIKFYRDYPKMGAIAMDFLKIRDAELKNDILGDSQRMGDQYFIKLINERKKRKEIDCHVDSEMLNYLISSINMSFSDYVIDKGGIDTDDEKMHEAVEKLMFILRNGLNPQYSDD